ncbi:MAG: CsgE family curli-type amyloid fiber assembly protein [Nitrospinaceae bacterium]
MKTTLTFILCLTFWLAAPVNPGFASNNNGEIEISGLVISDTMTKGGQDLFEAFNTYWKSIDGLDYTITIKEKADSFRGSIYWIMVDDTTVFSGRLNPRPDLIEEVAKEAVKRCSRYILQRVFVSEELEFY